MDDWLIDYFCLMDFLMDGKSNAICLHNRSIMGSSFTVNECNKRPSCLNQTFAYNKL
jgi:hypothetical protein